MFSPPRAAFGLAFPTAGSTLPRNRQSAPDSWPQHTGVIAGVIHAPTSNGLARYALACLLSQFRNPSTTLRPGSPCQAVQPEQDKFENCTNEPVKPFTISKPLRPSRHLIENTWLKGLSRYVADLEGIDPENGAGVADRARSFERGNRLRELTRLRVLPAARSEGRSEDRWERLSLGVWASYSVSDAASALPPTPFLNLAKAEPRSPSESIDVMAKTGQNEAKRTQRKPKTARRLAPLNSHRLSQLDARKPLATPPREPNRTQFLAAAPVSVNPLGIRALNAG